MSQSGINMIVRQQMGRADPSSQALVVKPPKAPGKGFKVKFRTLEQQLANRVNMEGVRAAHHALPYAYKFFWMIYHLSPVRTIIIISVYIVQGLLPALRLRTGGDFIRQVRCPALKRQRADTAATRGNPVGNDEFEEPCPSGHHSSIDIHSRTERLESPVFAVFSLLV